MTKNNKTIHIIWGQSATMNLSVYLKENNITDEIYAVTDNLSIGHLNDMSKRATFLSEEYKSASDAYTDGVEPAELAKTMINSWQEMPDFTDKKIIIWHNQNVVEQIMLRMLVARFQECDLYQIDTNSPNKNATGFYMPNELGECLGSDIKISQEMQKEYIKDWERLISDDGMLRILQNDEIKTVDEDYYDEDIIKTCASGEQKVSRIIGSVMKKSGQFVSDTFVAYRLQQLVNQNKLEYIGEPKNDMWERLVQVA